MRAFNSTLSSNVRRGCLTEVNTGRDATNKMNKMLLLLVMGFNGLSWCDKVAAISSYYTTILLADRVRDSFYTRHYNNDIKHETHSFTCQVSTYAHAFPLWHTHTQQPQLLLHMFTTYICHLIAVCHEPCNQTGRGGEEKTTITERSAVKLWIRALPSLSIITSITSHTQTYFHLIPSPKPCSVGMGNMEEPGSVTPSNSAEMFFSSLFLH